MLLLFCLTQGADRYQCSMVRVKYVSGGLVGERLVIFVFPVAWRCIFHSLDDESILPLGRRFPSPARDVEMDGQVGAGNQVIVAQRKTKE
jgi:hypothetical protein